MKANKSDCETVQEMIKGISQMKVFSHYLGISSLPVVISSPLRSDDTHPSFFIYSPDGKRVLYKDYATGDWGDIYSLLCKLKGISLEKLVYSLSLNQDLASDKEIGETEEKISSKPEQTAKPKSEIRVKVREWTKADIAYWNTYGITLQWLKYADVHPISHKIVYKDSQRYVFPAARLAYVFVERKEGNVSFKIYQPLSKHYKWRTNNDGSVVGLWTKIPKSGEKLVICSSLKDALCLWIHTGIPAVYVQSETTGMSDTAIEVLKSRYKHIFICFDNDAPGLKDGVELSSHTGFTNIILPQFEGGKDISDLYKTVGKEKFISIVKPLFDINDCGRK